MRADDPGDGIGCNGMSVLVPMAIGVEVEALAVGAPVGRPPKRWDSNSTSCKPVRTAISTQYSRGLLSLALAAW